MAKLNQDFITYSGDGAVVDFTVLNSAGVAIDISAATAITWQARRGLDSAVVLQKSVGDGIALVPAETGVFQLTLGAADTLGLTGYYFHQAKVTAGGVDPVTVTLGRMQVGVAPIWTYTGDPQNSDRDAVRFYIQDTDSANPQIYDAEIDMLLAQFGSPLYAAAQAARSLGAKYARKVSKRVGDLSINYGDIAKNYSSLADELQQQAEQTGISSGIYIGGISRSDMAAVAAQSDRVKQPFDRKQFDIPNSADSAQIPDENC